MTISSAQYEATIRRLESGLAELSRLVQRLPAEANAAADRWYVPSEVGAWLVRTGNVLAGIGGYAVRHIEGLMKGALAPVLLIDHILTWGDVRGLATTFAGQLQPAALSVDTYWKGAAADAYKAIIPAHSAAAARIGAIADKAQLALGWSVSAVLAFYAGLLAVVIQLIIAFIGVVTLLGSVAFSWAGLMLAVEKAKLGFAEVLALVTLFSTALGIQVLQLGNLHSEALDSSVFPGGRWPGSSTERYTDASVADGDAEWSIERW